MINVQRTLKLQKSSDLYDIDVDLSSQNTYSHNRNE